jgi:hypothetical protein
LNSFRSHIVLSVGLILGGAIGQSIKWDLCFRREVGFNGGGHEGVCVGNNAAVAHMVGMEIMKPSDTRDISLVNGKMVFLNKGLHVFQLFHNANGSSDFVKGE